MTELDRVGSFDTLNLTGFHGFCKSARSARGQREQRWHVCTVMVLLHVHFCSKSLGFRLPV